MSGSAFVWFFFGLLFEPPSGIAGGACILRSSVITPLAFRCATQTLRGRSALRVSDVAPVGCNDAFVVIRLFLAFRAQWFLRFGGLSLVG